MKAKQIIGAAVFAVGLCLNLCSGYEVVCCTIGMVLAFAGAGIAGWLNQETKGAEQ